MGRVLHLFGNHKVTGPAELALETVRALCAAGVDARLFSSDPRRTQYRDRWLHLLAEERGVPTEEIPGVRLPKHIHPVRVLFDVRRLAAHLRQDPPALVHCHLPGDHYVAMRALRSAGLSIPLVRSLYDGEAPRPKRRNRVTLGSASKIVCHSAQVAGELSAAPFEVDPARVEVIPPPIDVVRFDPERGVAARREALGVPEDAICLGIVARMQTHRRFEVLLEAFRQAREQEPRLHLVIVGRGTNQETVAHQPVRELGLEGAVHFSGYVSGEDYVGTLASFDAKVFMVPGSDGTCRAVREALAMGLPVLTTRRGMLPELVRHDVDGWVSGEAAHDWRDAFLKVAQEPETLASWSKAAREGAVTRFAYERFAERLRAVYGSLGFKA